MKRAVDLARSAEEAGHAPAGAVVTLDGEIVADGRDATVEPNRAPTRHAVVHALERLAPGLRSRTDEMTCYVTMEPCVMCAGALLIQEIGRVVFGAPDDRHGAGPILDHLPPGVADTDAVEWEGPVLPDVCGPLRDRAREVHGNPTDEPKPAPDAADPEDSVARLHTRLDAWLDDASELSVQQARRATERLARRLDVDQLVDILPYAAAVFRRGGYLKDYRTLERLAERAGHPEALDRVEDTLRRELPDIWVRRALEAGDHETAVDRWFEIEDHPRARLVADELVDACGVGRTQLVISCRLAKVSHLVGRGSRRRYRKACTILRKLRDELDRAGQGQFWHHIVDDLRTTYDNRPAFLDELSKAGFE